MLLGSCAKRILSFADLEDAESDFLASVDVQVKMAAGNLLSCDIKVYRNLEEDVGTALKIEHHCRV